MKVRRWRTIYHGKSHQKKAGVAIFISDKLDFKIKTVKRDGAGIIKGLIHQEDPTIVNTLCSKHGKPKYIKQLITNIKNIIDNNNNNNNNRGLQHLTYSNGQII